MGGERARQQRKNYITQKAQHTSQAACSANEKPNIVEEPGGGTYCPCAVMSFWHDGVVQAGCGNPSSLPKGPEGRLL